MLMAVMLVFAQNALCKPERFGTGFYKFAAIMTRLLQSPELFQFSVLEQLAKADRTSQSGPRSLQGKAIDEGARTRKSLV